MTFDPAAIQRAAADLPTSVLNTLQQVAGQHTPYAHPLQVPIHHRTVSRTVLVWFVVADVSNMFRARYRKQSAGGWGRGGRVEDAVFLSCS